MAKQTYTDWVFPLKIRSRVPQTPKAWEALKWHFKTTLGDNYDFFEFHLDKGGPTEHFPESKK